MAREPKTELEYSSETGELGGGRFDDAAYAVAQRPLTDHQWADYAVKTYRLTGVKAIKSSGKQSRQHIALVTFLTYQVLDAIGDRIDSKIKEINRLIDDAKNKPELDTLVPRLREAVAGLRMSVSEQKGFRKDIKRMTELTRAYSKELRHMGIDQESMLKDLSSYSWRVTCQPVP